MAFDPDKYLAEKEAAPDAFDPDAYLAEREPAAPPEEPGFFDMVTGESRMTPEMEQMQEVGAAPELNRLSVPAFKASLGLLTTGETEPLKAILSQQLGEDVSFAEDAKGNVIVNLPSGSYALNKPGLSTQDITRGVFDMLAFTTAGRAASIPGAIGKSAATEAALETAEQEVGGEFDAEEVVLAGGLGGFFKGAEDLIGAGYRAIKGKPTDEIVEAGAEAGVPVLTSDIRQPKTFAGRMAQQTGEKIPLAGTGAAREGQQELREQAVADVAEKYGQFSYDSIVQSLKDQKDRVKSAAGSVLQSTGRKLDDLGQIQTSNTDEAIGVVLDEVLKPGVIKSDDAVKSLEVLVDGIWGAPQTFTTLKENRTAFRDIVKSFDKAERSQLTSRAKSLLDDVERAMTKDMEAQAKRGLTPAEFSKWKKANKVYGEQARTLTKSRLKNVLDKGDITPEAVKTVLFSQNPSEVRLLYKGLTNEGRANARSAIISKVTNDLAKRQAGLTPSTFASEMKKYGLQTNEFFKGEEKRQLQGLLKVLDATRRAQEAAVTTPTGQQLLGAGTLAAAATDLGATIGLGGTAGTIARIYESAPVRNALLRLDSIPKGSTQFEQALREAVAALSSASQAARESQQE